MQWSVDARNAQKRSPAVVAFAPWCMAGIRTRYGCLMFGTFSDGCIY